MSLTGYDPFSPIPENVREIKPGQGESATINTARDFIVIGNRLSSGTEPLDAISDEPVADESDLITRVGAGSEAYWMVYALRQALPTATIYLACPTEASGTAASVHLVVANASDAASAIELCWGGFKLVVPIDDQATAQETADRIKAYGDDWEGGAMPFTFGTPVLDGSDYDIPVTWRHDGPRGTQGIEGASATKGLRVRAIGANAQTVTKDTASAVAGATEDDHTTILTAVQAMIKKGKAYHVITPKSDATPSVSDNGLGELSKLVKDMALPSEGLSSQFHAGTRLGNSSAVSQATTSAMNNWRCKFWWAEDSDWTTGMIAAHMAGTLGREEIAHPGANVNGLSTNIPEPPTASAVPTRAEVVNALNNGLSVLEPSGGSMRITRCITNQSLGATGNNDYRVREGHLPSVYDFAWDYFLGRMVASEQPFADNDPPDGAIPPASTTTPSLIKGVHDTAIRELTSSKPLGIYNGPILRPSAADDMIANSSVVFTGAGAFSLTLNWEAVQHRIKPMPLVNGVDAAY